MACCAVPIVSAPAILSAPLATAPEPARTPLAEAAVWRAVQLIEQDGPLEDSQALRQAFAAQAGDGARLHERAWLLGQRLGLDREWARWRQLGSGVLLALAVLVAAAAWLLARLVLGEERQINAVAAFVSLLGLHALTWLVWFCSLWLPWSSKGGGALGRWALQLTARLPLDRGPHALQLARATTDVLVRNRLAPWAFGGISHVVWTLSFFVLLAGLALGFALRAYRLSWETTILTPGFFVGFVQATGWLPGVLGFPVPDAATLLAPDAAGADQRDWAWWLIGCVAVYGLGLRLLSAAWCALAWRRGQRRLAPDLTDPYARRLLARLAALAPADVVDVEQPSDAARVPAAARTVPQTALRVLLGFELPPESDWPPETPAPATQVHRIDGTQEERAALLRALAAAPPQRLLVACHAPSSPDRGTARFLREATAGAMAVLLLGARQESDTARWSDWLQHAAGAPLTAYTDAREALDWLEGAA